MFLSRILADLKTIAEIAAYVSAAGFFVWKLRSGYLIVNAAISLKVDRAHRDATTDHLAISATLTKRGIGSLVLHDAQARVTHAQDTLYVELVGYDRLSWRTDRSNHGRSILRFDEKSSSKPFLFLTPDEEATFSVYTQVPRFEPCVIEVAVSGKRVGRKQIGQWRSSVVSLPQLGIESDGKENRQTG